MKFQKSVLLVFLVLLIAIVSACGAPAPILPTKNVSDLGEKISSVGAYGIYTFSYSDDQCFISTDDSMGSIDAVAISCDFGVDLKLNSSDPVYLGSVGNYTIYYIVYGDNECYIATDDGWGSIDAVTLDCSEYKRRKMNSPFRAFLILMCLVFATTACVGAPEPVHTGVPSGTVSADAINNGDMWYLPINLDGLPEANIEIIFSVIKTWQLDHPELEIIDVDYLYMQNTYSSHTSNYTYGISLLTKPK